MNAEQLQLWLERNHACQAGRDHCHGRTLREAWDSCDRPWWILWASHKAGERYGHLTTCPAMDETYGESLRRRVAWLKTQIDFDTLERAMLDSLEASTVA